MTKLTTIIAAALAAIACMGAVPLKWTVETSRVQPVTFDAVKGETMTLEASFQSYGKPFEMAGKACSIFWQTNGMGNAWWQSEATAISNRITAIFTPSMDPGATQVRGYLGSTGDIYRAAYTIRFKDGPGAIPNVIEQPPRVLDLANTVVINPAWPTQADFAATTTAMRVDLKGYVDEQITGAGLVSPQMVTNIATGVTTATVTKAYVENLGISAGLTTNDVKGIVPEWSRSPNPPTADQIMIAAGDDHSVFDAFQSFYENYNFLSSSKRDMTNRVWITDNVINHNCRDYLTNFRVSHEYCDEYQLILIFSDGVGEYFTMAAISDGIWPDWNEAAVGAPDVEVISGPAWSHGSFSVFRSSETNLLVISSEITAATNGLYSAANGNALAAQVAAIGTHLNAEDAKFVVTNYNSVTKMPEAYVEIKLPDQSWSRIWSEMTRFNWMTNTYLPTNYATKAEIEEKADRAWGYYDSHSGNWAPEGYTWISSPKIAIAADLAYQRTITSEGEIWVLCSQGMITETGGTTNGFFRISDNEGNVAFEIVSGSKRTVGATATNLVTLAGFTPTKMRIAYQDNSDAHPTIEACTSLTNLSWKKETDADSLVNVSWSGTSGHWVAEVQAKAAQSQLFVKASYEAGGETIVKNTAPVSMTHVYINNVKYAVGTATISGNTVMTLTPAN